MSLDKILAPHTEQDGWVYVRIKREKMLRPRHFEAKGTVWDAPLFMACDEGNSHLAYADERIGSRVISSRRVEQDVETGGFLRKCAEEGLTAMLHHGEWAVGRWCAAMPAWPEGFYMCAANGGGAIGTGHTLREAYYRYHAQADAS